MACDGVERVVVIGPEAGHRVRDRTRENLARNGGERAGRRGDRPQGRELLAKAEEAGPRVDRGARRRPVGEGPRARRGLDRPEAGRNPGVRARREKQNGRRRAGPFARVGARRHDGRIRNALREADADAQLVALSLLSVPCEVTSRQLFTVPARGNGRGRECRVVPRAVDEQSRTNSCRLRAAAWQIEIV